jgi:predicted nucleic acid-binding protein
VSVFVDTSAFYAVLDADDGRHADAARVWESLLDSRDPIHTTSYVIVETTRLLQNRIGLDGLRLFAADILPVVQLLWVDEGMHRSAMHALLVAGQRRLSLVDCVSFEAMRGLGIETAFCFDPHFAQQGFHIVPGARAGHHTLEKSGS